MECVWNMHGIRMEYAGIVMECVWNMQGNVWNMHGIRDGACMARVCNKSGICMEYV